MRHASLLLLLVTLLTAQAPVPAAAAEEEGTNGPARLLDEAGQKMLDALKLMLKAIPQYAAPEINEDGDIIIRRLNPPKEGPKPERRPQEDDRTPI